MRSQKESKRREGREISTKIMGKGKEKEGRVDQSKKREQNERYVSNGLAKEGNREGEREIKEDRKQERGKVRGKIMNEEE